MLEELKNLEKEYSLQGLQNEVSRQINLFKKERDKIRKSDDPVYDTPGKREYEIAKIRKVFDKNMQAVEQAYQTVGAELIAEQEEIAATSTITPSQADKESVTAIAEDFIYSVTMAVGDDEKLAEISELGKKLDHMSQERKVALRRQLPALMRQVEGEPQSVRRGIRSIGQGLADIKTEEQGALDLLKQDVAAGGMAEYRTLLAAEQAAERRRKQWEGLGDTLNAFEFETEYKTI